MKRFRGNLDQDIKTGYYKIGDKVEAIKTHIGAWFDADILDILPYSICLCGRRCSCIFKLLFEGDDEEDAVERHLDEIRQITFASYHWEDLKPGMKVVINYNVENPGAWGYWYDFLINTVIKSNENICLRGTVLVGYNGSTGKIPLEIDSDNVADVLEIKPHATLKEKEKENYATGVKPEYCGHCKNRPIKKCKICSCCICGIKTDFMITLQCDECCKWFHTYCLEPPLMTMPPDDDDWYCQNCKNENPKIEYDLTSRSSKVSKAMKPKRKYVRRNNNVSTENPESVSSANQETQIRTKFFVPETTEVEEITQKIYHMTNIWEEIQNFYPKHSIQGIFVSMKEKQIIPDTNNADDEYELPLQVEVCILNDVCNKRVWDEAKEYLKNGKQAFLDQVEIRFTCPICCDLLRNPITLICKHNFCIACFFKSLSSNVYSCALCRTGVNLTEHYAVNQNLETALDLLFSR